MDDKKSDISIKIVLVVILFTSAYFAYRCQELENELIKVKSSCIDLQTRLKYFDETIVQSDSEVFKRIIWNNKGKKKYEPGVQYTANTITSEEILPKKYPSRKTRQTSSCSKGEKGDKGSTGEGSSVDCLFPDPAASVAEILKGLQEAGLRISEQTVISVKGNPGSPGADGIVGLPGMPGRNGIPGRSIKGDRGLTGEIGLPGEKGEKGIDGPKGVIGSPGPRGFYGIPGEKGNTGEVGIEGRPGVPGLPGPTRNPDTSSNSKVLL